MTIARRVERAWSGTTAADRALRAALAPAAAAYGAAVALRNRLFDAGWLAARRVPAHVVSVGNLTVGGTGKTPTVLWLAERLTARGRRVGIVARGYRKRRRGVVVVGEAGEPLVSAEEGGDEAVMLARRFPGPVVTGERRVEAAALACARFGLDTIVLDDGFQHRALARDADLVLVAADQNPQHLLPAGPLREPPTALGRARAVLALGGDGILPARPDAPPGVAAFRGRVTPSALVRVDEGRWIEEPLGSLAGQVVVAVAGVARPEGFLALLAGAGATVRRTLLFPDHHAYDDRDLREIAVAEGMRVTTEKDLAKLGGRPWLDRLFALRVAVEVEDGEMLVDTLLAP